MKGLFIIGAAFTAASLFTLLAYFKFGYRKKLSLDITSILVYLLVLAFFLTSFLAFFLT